MKNRKPLIIVLGEPNSVFIEILSKVFKKKSIKSIINYPIIIIGSKELILSQNKSLNQKLIFEEIKNEIPDIKKLKKKIYLINIKYNFTKTFDKISSRSKSYIDECFKVAIKFLNYGISDKLINGPISKKHFLTKRYPGITEYIFYKSNRKISKNLVMLLFNKNLTISPLTTHVPIKKISRIISQKLILNNVKTINSFFKYKFKINPKIAILGLNPHCETKSKFNEENLIIKPAVKKLKKMKININGPFPADTFFIKKNIYYFDMIIGIYHDQVLTPFKALYGFDASNITLGLPFLRMSVDHGPNENMLGKNKSSTKSLENIFNVIKTLK